jgi:spore germination protein YaaH
VNALALAWEAGCLVIPTVTNGFNASLTHGVLANPEARDRHIKNLVDLVIRHGYDGLDLDYESMAAADRELFSRFVEDLAAEFHAHDKILSVTVHAKTSDLGGGQGPQSQDYVRIGKAADMVKLMIYDYSWSGGQPGPVSPIYWGDQVLAYARQAIPAYKVMYGLTWYGYDWPGGGVKASSVDVVAARTLAQSKAAAIKRDASLEPSFKYKDAGGREHVVFYQDGESYSARLRMMQARHNELLGVAHWQIGNEAPEMWDVIRALREYGL